MFKLNTQCWPVVVFEFSTQQSVSEHLQMLDAWDELFKRNQAFVAVRLFRDDAAVEHSKEIGQFTLKWLDAGASSLIKSQVLAMINVTPELSYQRMKNKNVERVFGVPGGIFPSISDANLWLKSHFDDSYHIPEL